MLRPLTCPTCGGHRTVQKPPWVAGDQNSWTSSNTALYPCPSCCGNGVIWNEDQDYPMEGNYKTIFYRRDYEL